jgi:hypothetical protein
MVVIYIFSVYELQEHVFLYLTHDCIYTYRRAIDIVKNGHFGVSCLVKGGDECCTNMVERIVNIVASDWLIDGERHSSLMEVQQPLIYFNGSEISVVIDVSANVKRNHFNYVMIEFGLDE